MEHFYGTALSAGAILTGFCGTFLSFRLQREAAYFRQVAVDFEKGEARDILVGLTHFTGPLFLLILATLLSSVFGFAFPLLALANVAHIFENSALIAAGEIAALILVAGYFFGELIHYRILHLGLVNDVREWRQQWWLIILTCLLALIVFFAIFCYTPAV